MEASWVRRINVKFLYLQQCGHLFLTIVLHLVSQQPLVFCWSEIDNTEEISLDDAETIPEEAEVDAETMTRMADTDSHCRLQDIPDTEYRSPDSCSQNCPHNRTESETKHISDLI